MGEVLLPTWIVPETESQEWADEGSSIFRSTFSPGLAQRQNYGDPRLKLSRVHTVRLEEKAVLLSLLAKLKGSYNALRTKVHFVQRGSFPSNELLTNNTFESGTATWGASNSTLSVSDRILRMTTSSTSTPSVNKPVTVTPNLPYCLRSYISPNLLSDGMLFGVLLLDTVVAASSVSANSYNLATLAPTLTPLYAYIAYVSDSTPYQGDSLNVYWASLARCMIVDNGGNLLLQSNNMSVTWVPFNVTVASNSNRGINGALSADAILETAVNNGHSIAQAVAVPAAANDMTMSAIVDGVGRTWCYLQISDGANTVLQFFDLSGVGALGGTILGASWTNLRASIHLVGDGFYQCSLTARKISAATSVTAIIGASTGGGVASYLGTASLHALTIDSVGFTLSSFPGSIPLTTTAAVVAAPQTGNQLFVKGAPASTDGLLLPGDFFEIGNELKMVNAPFNSDGNGEGLLQFEPALVRSPANDAPIIIAEPMGRFLASNIRLENKFGLYAKVSYDLEHIYE